MKTATALLLALLASGARGQELTFTTFAGATFGSHDGTRAEARFHQPFGVAVDREGNLYVADSANSTIRKVTPSGQVTTLAGIAGDRGEFFREPGHFYYPTGIALDGNGNVYVADGTLWKIASDGAITEFAQSGTTSSVATDTTGNVYAPDLDLGIVRRFTPQGVATTVATGLYATAIAVAKDGTLYVTDREAIKKITPDGVIAKLAGDTGERSYQDGPGSVARFDSPMGLAVDGAGNVYVSDYGNFVIRKIAPDGLTSTLAGRPGRYEFADGQGSQARFYYPSGLTLADDGNLYVADSYNSSIRRVTLDGVVTTVAGAGGNGSLDGAGPNARFNFGNAQLAGITAADAAGNRYVSDTFNHTIRKIAPNGVVTTLAGSPGVAGKDDGIGSSARFNEPLGVALGPNGELYVADSRNGSIRKITADGLVTTLIQLVRPIGLAVDSAGNIYVIDVETIRKITPTLVMTTVAPLTQREPTGIAIGPDGTLYVAAWVGRIVTVTQDGTVTTLAGGSVDQLFSHPSGIAVDPSGNAWITDNTDNQIFEITPDGTTIAVAGNGQWGTNDGTGESVMLFGPTGIAVDGNGDVFVTDNGNNTVRKGVQALTGGATIDAATGYVLERRQLSAPPAPSCEWKIIRYPTMSHAQLSSTTACNPTFTPDVAAVYLFQLTASDGARSRISTVTLTATGRERRRPARH